MAQQRTLATAAAAHNDEDFPGLDAEMQVVLNHETAVGHGQIVDRNTWFCRWHRRAAPSLLEPKPLGQDCKKSIGGNDPDNTGHHCGGRRGPHCRGTATTLHAAQTASRRHQGAKYHSLAQTQPAVNEVHGLTGFIDVFHQGRVEASRVMCQFCWSLSLYYTNANRFTRSIN